MSKVDTFACDECGTQKKETNHWYMLYSQNGEGTLISVSAWDKELEKGNVYHACGRNCVLAMMNRWFSTWSFAKDQQKKEMEEVHGGTKSLA